MKRVEITVEVGPGDDQWFDGSAIFRSPHGMVNITSAVGYQMARYLRSPETWADYRAASKAMKRGRSTLAYLAHIEVDPGFRQAGEGGQLMRAAMAWLDAQNVRATFLYVMPTVTMKTAAGALSFAELTEWYKRYGFAHINKQQTLTEMIYNFDEGNSRVMIRPHGAKRRRR